MNRYFPRYFGKREGFLELYEVADRTTGEALSQPLPFDEAKAQSERRNSGQELDPYMLSGWPGLNPAAP